MLAAQREPGAARPPRNGQQAIWFLALCAVLVVSRWMTFPRYLITFDEINFALAVERFNPIMHQPQPPGYPLFVALLKLLSLIIPKIETVFFIAALVIAPPRLRWCGGCAT